QFLNRKFANRWIGRGTQRPNHLWPARSPDLNPVDFFLWGQLKSLVYATPIQNEEDLRNRIIDGCERIRNTPGIFYFWLLLFFICFICNNTNCSIINEK
ncbi:hypothetical protein X777_04330, partial [Ooceraea biroi]